MLAHKNISIQTMLQQAVSLHQRGQFAQAEAIYKSILEIKDNHFGALHMLGVIAMQCNKLHEAIELIGKAISIDPNQESAHSNLGYVFGLLKRHEEALASYDRALKIKPDYAEAHNNRGNTLLELRRHEEALASYDRALALKPDHANAHSNRGTALRKLSRYEEALASYIQALALKPDHIEAHYNAGNALFELSRYEEALASYGRALTLKPAYADAHYNAGNALRRLSRYEEALASYDRAVALNPDHIEAYCNRGTAFAELNRHEDALESYGRVFSLRPQHVEAHYNAGNTLFELGRYEEALASYDRALAFQPDHAEAYANRGSALTQLNLLNEALGSYARALALKPDYAEARWNESFCRLRLGEFEGGWKEYEWRWQIKRGAPLSRNFPQPLWLGEVPLTGKTILLHAEQGFGDTIQFIRYAGMVASQGATVLLEVQPALKTLLASMPCVTQIFAKGEELPSFDYQCPLLSLPLAFQTRLHNIPAEDKYLHNDPGSLDKWRVRLGQKSVPRIGLVWSGNTSHKNDRNRSMPLAEMVKLVSNQAQFFSLQKDVRADDSLVLNEHPEIHSMGGEFGDFSDTAAAISLMDLVITVDTSVAHLAGALGKPVWVLLPFSADWRWLLDRTDSPWYPSARLFRQDSMGDWQDVVKQVAVELRRFILSS